MQIIVLVIIGFLIIVVLFRRSPRWRFRKTFGHDPYDDPQGVRSAVWLRVFFVSDGISRFQRDREESERKIRATDDLDEKYYEGKALEYYCAMLKSLNAEMSHIQRLATKFCYGFVSREAAKLTYKDLYVVQNATS
ncbi:MAG: hypothetical protein WC650_01380 [Candidatus Doudnabacteria bacterium]